MCTIYQPQVKIRRYVTTFSYKIGTNSSKITTLHYADYVESEDGSRDCDYVFVNLFAAPLGTPMPNDNVYGLVRGRAPAPASTPSPRTLPAHLRDPIAGRGVDRGGGRAGPRQRADHPGHLLAPDVEDHRKVLVAAGLLKEGTTPR